jgi:hypothetical protein
MMNDVFLLVIVIVHTELLVHEYIILCFQKNIVMV